ncbi:MAG: Maleylacetoacetate isomerase (EC @ Glutathione S-transferase, zeta (EC [uncultured Caballeronia sp.]|nr:MAG: Maleylacetoacetate isomerase (EC @ Glutathione S-transferase, zeta (EC [uncultured Caballeronia sp.]
MRIALNLKGLDYEYVPIHLLREGGEQLKPEYRAVNPDGIVPTLIDGDDILTQSLAIIEYLEETHPESPLLPKSPSDRAFVRAVAMQVACEIHPLDNLRVLKYLKHQVKVPDEVKDAWYRHWVEAGFETLEKRLAGDKRVGALTFGDTPTVADLCLVPQVFNARRFGIDVRPVSDDRAYRRSRLHHRRVRKGRSAQQPDAE